MSPFTKSLPFGLGGQFQPLSWGGPEQRASSHASGGNLGQPVVTQNLGSRLKVCASIPKSDLSAFKWAVAQGSAGV